MPNTPLQDFREQYPQYNEWEDDELAEALRQRHYPDLDPVEYKRSIGLVEPEPEPEPSTWEKIKARFEDKKKTPDPLKDEPDNELADFDQAEEPREKFRNLLDEEPEADTAPAATPEEADQSLWSQLFAGWDEYRAGRETASAFEAIDTATQAQEVAEQGEPIIFNPRGGITNQLQAKRARDRFELAQMGDQDAIGSISTEVSDKRARMAVELQRAIDEGRERRERAESTPHSAETDAVLQAESFGAAMDELGERPLRIIAELGIRSLPNMAEAIPLALAGSLIAPGYGTAVGGGLGSAMVEYRSSFAGYLQERGVDINNADAILKAAESPQLMQDASRYAATRSGIIGTLDGVTGGLATKMLVPAAIKTAIGRELTNAVAQSGVQTVGGGTGEALAQLATTGEIKPGEVTAEAVAEGVSTPIDVGVATVTGARAELTKRRAERILAEAEKFLGRGGSQGDGGPSFPSAPEPSPAPGSPDADAPAGGEQFRNILDPAPADPLGDLYVDPDANVPILDDVYTPPTPPAAPEPTKPTEPTKDSEPTKPTKDTGSAAKPFVPHDPRLKREIYRNQLESDAGDLIKGGGVTYTRDERDQINGRTPSGNPMWFQSMMESAELKMSVKQVQAAVQKAINGKKLGIREQRVISAMLDNLTAGRTDAATLEYAYEDLDAARSRRREARGEAGYPDTLEPDGELFQEDEYPADWDADTRITFEAMSRAIAAGVPVDDVQRLAGTLEEQDLRNQLEALANEAERRSSIEAGETESGTGPDADAETITSTQAEVERAERDQQLLTSYQDAPPVDTQADAPKMEQAKAAAVESVEKLGAQANPLAKTLYQQFAEEQQVGLIGQTVNWAEDLATLAQVYRDGAFETFRMFFVDDAGKIISQLGISSRLPGSASAAVGPGKDWYSTMHKAAKDIGAAGIWLTHNHPSGESTPSNTDRQFTRAFAENFPEFFKGHVVIDTNNYSTIEAQGQVTRFDKDMKAKPLQPRPTTGDELLNSPRSAEQFALSLPTPGENEVTFIVVNFRKVATAVQSFPASILDLPRDRLQRLIQRAVIKDKGSNVIAVAREGQNWHNLDARGRLETEPGEPKLDILAMDVILVDGEGFAKSMASIGRYSAPVAMASVLPQGRNARLSSDSSPYWDFLRGVSQAEAVRTNRATGATSRERALKPVDPGTYPAKTDIPFDALVFTAPETDNEDTSTRVFGPNVTYSGFTAQAAGAFSAEAIPTPINLRNPFVLSNDADFRALAASAGYEGDLLTSDPDMIDERSARIRRQVAASHDGLIIQWETGTDATASEANPGGWKLLEQVFLVPQVIQFKRPPQAVRPSSQKEAITQEIARRDGRQVEIVPSNPTAQAIADLKRKKDAKRNSGQTEAETGNGGDLFSQAQNQNELFDGDRSDMELREEGDEYSPGKTRAERVKAMGMDELVAAVYADELTGIGNLKAYREEGLAMKYQGLVDADSLKWINNNLGLEAGDAMLIAIAEALDQSGVQAYRIGGDEFILAGNNEADLAAALELATGILANQTVESPKGRVKGIRITWAIGTDKNSADVLLERRKTEREVKGERAPRGEKPPGVEMMAKPETGNIDRMQPGSQYVPMIGALGALPITAQHGLKLGNGREVRIPKKPVRREHIIAVMRKHFGNRIYQGRVKGKGTLGFYRNQQGETRLKHHNDIEVAAHEIAHYFDDRYPWVSKLYKQFKGELKTVSYDEKQINEGFAEFMRLFLTQEIEAMQRCPSFYDAWQKALNDHKTLQSALFDIQELMHAWTMQGARQRAVSKTGTHEPAFMTKIRQHWPPSMAQAALDGLRAIKQIGLKMNSPQVLDAYERLRLAVGGSNGVLEAAFFYGTPGYREDGKGLEFTGEGLKEVFGDLWGSQEMGMYMLARRARELMTQGRENLMRVDEIVSWLSWGNENPRAAEVWERYQAYNSRMLDFAVASGVLSAKSRKAMEEMNKDYVPFYRVLESLSDRRSVKVSGNPFMRLKGGTQNVAVIWDNIIQQNGNLIRFAMINDGKRKLFRTLGKSGKSGGMGGIDPLAGTFAAPIGTDAKIVKIDKEQILKLIVPTLGMTWRDYQRAKTGLVSSEEEIALVQLIDTMADGLAPMAEFWLLGQDPTGDVTYYLEAGEKKWFEVIDRPLWDALEFTGVKATNLSLMFFGAFSATLRRGVVAVPVFQLKNFLRDGFSAWTLSKNTHFPFAKALRVVFSRLEKDKDYQLMLLNGGGFASRSQGLEAQRKVIVDPTHLFAIYDRFMGRFENANRLAEYKNTVQQYGPRTAAFLSREISTDFAMRGSAEVARFLAVAVPFMNARVQGLYRNKRALDRVDTAAVLAMKGALLATATLALYAFNKDDDRYKELPEQVKDLYWVFFTGDGEDDYFLFPKPFEIGMLFGTLPERIMELIEKENGKEFADALSWMFINAFALDPTPQPFQPMIDLSRNKDFAGAPIVPFYLQGVDASEQYQWYTSETMKEAGKSMGLSPLQMEYAVRGYFGTMGTYVLAASDAMISSSVNLYIDPVTGEEREFEEMSRGETWKENIVTKALIDPLVNEGPPRSTKYLTDMYDLVEEAQGVADTAALMIKRRDDAAEAYLANPDNAFLEGLIRNPPGKRPLGKPILSDLKASLTDIRQDIEAVRADPTLSGDAKRIQVWELIRVRNQLAREVVEQIEAERAKIRAQPAPPTDEDQ